MADCMFQRAQWQVQRDWEEVGDWFRFWDVQCSVKLKRLGNGK